MEAVAENKSSKKVPDLFTVSCFVERHDFITNGGLRFQIFDAENNGLEEAEAIVRIGRRVLINEENYFGWIESQQKENLKSGPKAPVVDPVGADNNQC